MKYFAGCATLRELKDRRNLCVRALHPDRGGNADQFREMEEQFSEAVAGLQQKRQTPPRQQQRQAAPPPQHVIVVQQVVTQAPSQGMQVLERLLIKGAEVLLREGLSAITNNEESEEEP